MEKGGGGQHFIKDRVLLNHSTLEVGLVEEEEEEEEDEDEGCRLLPVCR